MFIKTFILFIIVIVFHESNREKQYNNQKLNTFICLGIALGGLLFINFI